MYGLVWWTGYTIVGIWLQFFVPGVDFLAPGLVISMQEHGGGRTFWLAALWILLQEGMGSLSFGYGIAWYGALVLMYMAGRWLFESKSVLFMILLGVGLGALHVLLVWAMASLELMSVPMRRVLLEGLAQMAAFPVFWAMADRMFPKRLRVDERPL